MPTIDEVVASLKANLGDQIVAKGTEMRIDSVSTGSLSVDLATGVSGFPKGYITELFGPEGGGKSTLCLESCINNAMRGGFSVYMDVENKTYPGRPVELGMDP